MDSMIKLPQQQSQNLLCIKVVGCHVSLKLTYLDSKHNSLPKTKESIPNKFRDPKPARELLSNT